MKRWILIIFVVLAQSLVVVTASFAGASATQSFKLFVTIPAIVGINVPDPAAAKESTEMTVSLISDDIAPNSETDIVRSERMVDNQRVIFQTVVVR